MGASRCSLLDLLVSPQSGGSERMGAAGRLVRRAVYGRGVALTRCGEAGSVGRRRARWNGDDVIAARPRRRGRCGSARVGLDAGLGARRRRWIAGRRDRRLRREPAAAVGKQIEGAGRGRGWNLCRVAQRPGRPDAATLRVAQRPGKAPARRSREFRPVARRPDASPAPWTARVATPQPARRRRMPSAASAPTVG